MSLRVIQRPERPPKLGSDSGLVRVRGLDGGLADYWDVVTEGYLHVNDDGSDAWRTTPDTDQTHLVRKMNPKKIAAVIEELMLRQP